MAKIRVLQNVQCENLGIISQVLQSYGLEPEYIHTYAGEPVPKYMKDAAGLIVLGGPMSVYEINQHPFLTDAMRLIDQALKHEQPVLGICLGSQLLATVLGATVTRGVRKEIGWHPIELTGAARDDLLLSGVPRSFTSLHWHGDIFDLPAGATHLASSALTPCQAFVHGLGAYGILFHMEVTEKIVQDMVSSFADELAHEGLDGQEIIDEIHQQIHGLQSIGRTVYQNWATLCLEVMDS
jgi:GMP synthase (glutamine-hydrolysing)